MANSKSNRLLKDDEPMVDVSSLIDVCFLLLIFFLVTSTILPTERDLPLSLPPIEGAKIPTEDIVISLAIGSDGEVRMSSGGTEEVLDHDINKRELPKLVDRLKLFQMVAGPNDVVVMLDVDDHVPQQRFIDVVNCLAGEEITKMAFIDGR